MIADVPLTIAPGRFTPEDHREPPRCRKCERVLLWDRSAPATDEAAPARRNRNKRGGRDTICAPCVAAHRRAYRAANLEVERARRRARYAANLETERARARTYYAANLETERERARANMRALTARNAARTPEEIAGDRARLRPDGTKRCRRCREVLDLEAFGSDVTRADGLEDSCRDCAAARVANRRRARYLPSWADRDLWRDWMTGEAIEPDALHVEHVVPVSLGGPDEPENTAPASAASNLWKSARPLPEVLEECYPGVLAAVADWPAIDLDGGPVGTFGDLLSAA